MKTRSAKAKGRRLQNRIVQMLSEAFPQWHPDDIRPAIMGESGADIKLSPAAQQQCPWAIEAKNQERVNLWKAYAQAEAHAREKSNTEPILVVSKNHIKEPLAVVRFSYLIRLLVALHEKNI